VIKLITAILSIAIALLADLFLHISVSGTLGIIGKDLVGDPLFSVLELALVIGIFWFSFKKLAKHIQTFIDTVLY
jgi:hypothetical protein